MSEQTVNQENTAADDAVVESATEREGAQNAEGVRLF